MPVCRQNWTHALGCIVMHPGMIYPVRFWRVSGWFGTCFTVLPSGTRTGRFSGTRNETLW
ncbi:hypothetical protein CP989_23635 [Enterobacter hormaechei]|nr:hypothetical protein CP989_23635 [Enterobacter hormaechei]PCO16802.1 hypothetical protein CQA18_23890 [Enterobacter hormaechei]